MSYVNLSGANISWSSLIGCNFVYADLSNANLSYSDLRGVSLKESNMRMANLDSSNLHNVSFRRVNMTGMSFLRTCLIDGGVDSFGNRYIGQEINGTLMIYGYLESMSILSAFEMYNHDAIPDVMDRIRLIEKIYNRKKGSK